MAASRVLLRSSSQSPLKPFFPQTLRFSTSSSPTTPSSSSSSSSPSHDNAHKQTHVFLSPNSFVGSWAPPRDPEEAQAELALLRRQYAKQVKQLRKDYIHEVELRRLEKQRKDEAKREALRLDNEQRRAEKAAVAKVKAAERKVAQEEFRQTLLKERAEKLENWKMKENLKEDKKKEKNELLHRQSSLWVDEHELEKKILETVVNTTPL